MEFIEIPTDKTERATYIAQRLNAAGIKTESLGANVVVTHDTMRPGTLRANIIVHAGLNYPTTEIEVGVTINGERYLGLEV